jgi:hypothetical protein
MMRKMKWPAKLKADDEEEKEEERCAICIATKKEQKIHEAPNDGSINDLLAFEAASEDTKTIIATKGRISTEGIFPTLLM